ncbi:acid protease [Meira miltonrushii]|uniref:Acid protease n=1 Tax=Meira miltonrushii TaxID=1280837 RepID=A0A316VAK5_9BASI|nr:acid protease [Meira miltonrushii]PWN34284.1 acid protease [Meira miltonrushii]
MVYLTAKFIHFFLVLVTLGFFDHSPIASFANAAPTGAANVPARVGIVIKEAGAGTGDSTAASSLAPSRRGSSFEQYDLAVNKDAVKVPLEHVDARDTTKVHPFMLFQQHMNRANVKLAKMQKRSPPSPEDLTRALWNRRRSIEASYGGQRRFEEEITIDPLDVQKREDTLGAGTMKQRAFKASTSNLPSSHGRIGVKLIRELPSVSEEQHDHQKRLWPGVLSSFTNGESKNDDSSKANENATKTGSLGSVQPLASAKAQANQYAYSDTLLKASTPTAAKSLGLAIEANNIGYVATVQFGAKKTPFKMLIDSGSADTWVPSSKCNDCGKSQQRLSKSVSNTLQTSKEQWSITYGTGNAKGYLATDDLSIAGMDIKDYKFALVTQESDDFSSSPFDGLMGLAKEILSNSRSPTPIDALYNEKLVTAPVMGYKLGDATTASGKRAAVKDGEVTFGGVDSGKYTGQLVEIPNVSQQGFFEIPIQGVSVNGKSIASLSSGRTSILDTGTSLMVAPQQDAEAVHAQIPGAKSDGQGGFTVPCTTNSTLSFKFGGEEWPLLPRDMIFVPVDANNPKGDCISSLGGGDVGQQGEWLVGAVALKRLYFATNAQKNVIGLGKLRNPGQ